MIGCGGRAHGIANTCREVPSPHRGRLRLLRPKPQRLHQGTSAEKWGAYHDFRKMLEKEKLDGVMIETTTHARAWIAIQAMQAGLDAYIEKPMCLTITEGRTMVNAAQN